MNAFDILEAITDVEPDYIVSAGGRLDYLPAKHGRRSFRRAAALVAAVLAAAALSFTTAMAASPEFRETVMDIIETLFPPKNIQVSPEGMGKDVPHSARGREPEEGVPGFAIYVDDFRYSMSEENGVFYIRPPEVPISREAVREDSALLLEGLSPEEQEAFIDRRVEELKSFYAALPPCEMEISELESLPPSAAAEAERLILAEGWDSVSETEADGAWLHFSASGGTDWDSPREEHYFRDNGRGGTFHIVTRCYLEAVEGHGARFRAMLDTFSLIGPQGDGAAH